MTSGLFSPQVLITSLLAAATENFYIPIIFNAWLNIFLVTLGSFWIGNLLKLKTHWSLLLAITTATQPMVLYIFYGFWWNCAGGYAWLVMATAALMQFYLNRSALNFILATMFGSFLFATAMTHLQMVFIFLALLMIFAAFREKRKITATAPFIGLSLCIILMAAIPVMSEFIANATIVSRNTGFQNIANLGVPSWGHIINFFNPFYNTSLLSGSQHSIKIEKA
jgi:hypothetical protein